MSSLFGLLEVNDWNKINFYPGSLGIKNISINDSGIYKCVVSTNESREVETDTTLIVRGE